MPSLVGKKPVNRLLLAIALAIIILVGLTLINKLLNDREIQNQPQQSNLKKPVAPKDPTDYEARDQYEEEVESYYED